MFHDKFLKKSWNLKTIYHIENVSCDTQMRTILDEVSPEEIRPAYKGFFRELQRGNALEPMVFLKDVICWVWMEPAIFLQRNFSLIVA